MIRIFRCSYCDFESQDYREVIEHEKSHVRQIECVKVQGKDVVPCVMGVIEKLDSIRRAFYELTFTWDAVVTNKEMPSVFQVRKIKMQDACNTELISDKDEALLEVTKTIFSKGGD